MSSPASATAITHLDAYAHGPAIAFENGAADTHVPLDGAIRFRDALRTVHPDLADRVRITAHPGVEHLDGAQSQALLDRSIEWLLQPPHTGDAGM